MSFAPPVENEQAPPPAGLAPVYHALHAFETRLKWQLVARSAGWSLALGFASSSVIIYVWRALLTKQAWYSPLLILAVVVAAPATAAVWHLTRGRTPLAAARVADTLLALDDCLSTAVETHSRSASDPVALALYGDAINRAERINPARDLPLRVRLTDVLVLMPALAMVASALLLPSITRNPDDLAVRAQIQVEQRRIEELAKQLRAGSQRDDAALLALINELGSLSNDLGRSELSREKAVARLSETAGKLTAATGQTGREQEAIDTLARQLQASSSPSLKPAGEALASGDRAALDDALRTAAELLASAAPEEKKAISQTLLQAGKSVAPLDPGLAQQLGAAAEAINDGGVPATQSLERAGQSIKDALARAQSAAQISRAVSAIEESRERIAEAGSPPHGEKSQPQVGAATAVGAGTPQVQVANVGGQSVSNGTPLVSGATPTGPAGPSSVPGGQADNGGAGRTGGTEPGSAAGSGHTDTVYAPSPPLQAGLTPVTVPAGTGVQGDSSSGMSASDRNYPGTAQVPYAQVFGRYKEQAAQALDREYIPQGYKDLVRDYFSNIDPENGP